MTQILITIELIMSYKPCYHPTTGKYLEGISLDPSYANEGYLPEDYSEPLEKFIDHPKVPERDKLWLVNRLIDSFYEESRIGTESVNPSDSLEEMLHKQRGRAYGKMVTKRRLDREECYRSIGVDTFPI